MILSSNSGKRNTLVEAGVGITVGSVGGAATARWNDIVETVVQDEGVNADPPQGISVWHGV